MSMLLLTLACLEKHESEPADTTDSQLCIWYVDADADGFGGGDGEEGPCGAPPSGTTETGGDCEDADATIHPDAEELCDGLDNDCSGVADDDLPDWYVDADLDGHGDPNLIQEGCEAPEGTVADGDDCDDGNAEVYPGADEHCDGEDEDCDGEADEEAVDPATWYVDADGDGHGGTGSVEACEAPENGVANSDDCNDGDEAVYPGAQEVCDADDTDEDCDGKSDDDDASVTGEPSWYRDSDGDGYGRTSKVTTACEAPSGYVSADGDCSDDDAAVNPGATELCDEDDVDEDCDGLSDDADAAPSGTTAWYADNDGDGYGDAASSAMACDAPSGMVADATDCYDLSGDAHPDATDYQSVDRGDGSFDYDCDSSETRQYPSLGSCTGTSTCSLSNGWESSVPACGDSAAWLNSCSKVSSKCTGGTTTRTQSCR